MILFGYTDNQGVLLGNRESRYEPWGSSIQGAWFSSWYVLSIDTGHIAQSPQSSPRWSPAFNMEPVLSVSSFKTTALPGTVKGWYSQRYGFSTSHVWRRELDHKEG